MTKPQLELEKIVERLRPLLAPSGFRFQSSSQGCSSGGPYASGYFTRGHTFRIGLVVRGESLGMPSYEWGPTVRGHVDVIRNLGREKDALLQWNRKTMKATTRWTLFGHDPKDVVEALESDLKNIILPALEKGEIGQPPALPKSRLPRWMLEDDSYDDLLKSR